MESFLKIIISKYSDISEVCSIRQFQTQTLIITAFESNSSHEWPRGVNTPSLCKRFAFTLNKKHFTK